MTNTSMKKRRTPPARRMAQPSVAGSDLWGSPSKVKLLLGTVCFISGAAVMIVELTGIRVLAPLFGNSLYTWTALIGVVLVAFSIGGYLGGWLADRSPNMSVLVALLAGSALSIVFIPPLKVLFGDALHNQGLVGGPMLLSLLLFTIPGCLLGAVSPFTVRLLARHGGDKRIGAAAGFVGMSGSLGSFVGTFATGFVLIPSFGVKQIFLVSAVMLILLAIAISLSFRRTHARSSLATLGALSILGVGMNYLFVEQSSANTIFSKQTYYHLIQVKETGSAASRTVRTLQLDTTVEGGQDTETGELTVRYQAFWELAKRLESGVSKALFLGAGAFGMPQHVAKQWPDSEVDVVEIDPAVIQVGHDFFRLGEYENIESYAMDARRFLNVTDKDYDFIFADAYNGVRYIPAHLTTVEFFRTAQDRLDADGVFMMNIISATTGERAQLFRAVFSTLSEVFENVEVFSTSPFNTDWASNVLLLAGDRELESFYEERPGDGELTNLLRSRIEPDVYQFSDRTLLTDDHNPIEYIVAQQLRQ